MTKFCFIKRCFNSSCVFRQWYNSKVTKMENSGLAYIEIKKGCSPFELFRTWLEESKQYGNFKSTFFSLATANLCGEVSNRTVVLKDFKDSGFTFLSKQENKKSRHIVENSNVAACFLWCYKKDEKSIIRQVRIEGNATKIPHEECQKYFDDEPLSSKIRAHICHQGQKVDWNELRKNYDEILRQVKDEGLKLKMPDNVTAYKILPKYFDFYYSWDDTIADRIIFEKSSAERWTFDRVAA